MDTAKLFQNGRSQAVRLPLKYRFEGSEVYVKRFGNGVLLLPEESSWDGLIESLDGFSEDFMSERNQGDQSRESLF